MRFICSLKSFSTTNPFFKERRFTVKQFEAYRLVGTALAVLAVLALAGTAFSQGGGWVKAYGDTGAEFCWSVQQTTDGGYILAGQTQNSYQQIGQVYLVKTDAQGNVLWSQHPGSPTGSDIVAECVRKTTDGGYILTGSTYNPTVGYDRVFLMKTNSSGSVQWTRTYTSPTTDSTHAYGACVQQTTNGGYIVSGCDGELNVFLIKTNASGGTLWKHTIASGYDLYGSSLQQTTDGGYIVAGYSPASTQKAGILVKTDSSGNGLWTNTFSTGSGYSVYLLSVQQTTDGGYIAVGNSRKDGTLYRQGYLVKTNASGGTLWTRLYGRPDSALTQWICVRQTADGGYIATGSFWKLWCPDPPQSAILDKFDASGNLTWEKLYNLKLGNVPGPSFGFEVQQTTDRGYIIGGYVYKKDTTSSNAQGLLIKTDSLGVSGAEEKPEGRKPQAVIGLKTTPNPFVSYTAVPGHEREQFSLYDVSGRKVGTYRGDRIGEGLRAGVYFLKSEGKDAKPVRIVKVR